MGTDDRELLELLAQVKDKTCWSVLASERTDYVIVLEAGEKLRRSMRLANPRLSFLQRTFEGEYSFLIECAWRLDGPRGVVVSCYDPNGLGGTMLGGLAELEGRVIEDVAARHAGRDLELTFAGDYVLRCLSTETDVRRKRNNWALWSPAGLVTCGPRGLVRREARADAERRVVELKRRLHGEDEHGGLLAPAPDGEPDEGGEEEGRPEGSNEPGGLS